MRFHAPTKRLTFATTEVEAAAFYLLNAIKNVREASRRPLKPYRVEGPLRKDDLAMKSILDAAKALGIDLGAEWGNELDVSGEA